MNGRLPAELTQGISCPTYIYVDIPIVAVIIFPEGHCLQIVAGKNLVRMPHKHAYDAELGGGELYALFPPEQPLSFQIQPY